MVGATAGLWPGPDQRAALLDFWEVYDRHYEAISTELMPWFEAHPVFGPMMAALPPEQLERQRVESYERLRAAMQGDWAPYEQDLRVQGAVYARLGMSIRDWHEIVRSFERFLIPRLVRAYAAEPVRLSACIVVMQDFLDSAMCLIAEAFLAAKEADLRESEHRLATTLDSIGDAVIATDAGGRIARMNPVAERLTGWPLAEALGRDLEEVFDIRNELTGERAEAPVARVLRDGTVVGLANHTELRSRNGVVRPIADSAAPIRSENGETVAGVVLVFRDQSEERLAEETRLRGLRLEEQNLRAQEASRLKSEFLANMSHELRTPLNSILGFSQFIQDGDAGPVSAQQFTFLGHILSSGRHLLQLINDVLDLAKVESGKMEFRPERLDLVRLSHDVRTSFETACRAKSLSFEVAVDAEVEHVVADAARLRQVLDNFVSNAVKFTPEGGLIQLRVAARGAAEFVVEVEDSGIGIAPEDIQRLFVEFQQLDAGIAKQHQGTGLGLALTRRLVEAQGGAVGVRSEVGTGSVFFAVLPRRPAAITRGAEGPVVIVVDDDEGSLALMTSVLAQLGHGVVCARDVEAGLRLAAEVSHTAVMLDLLLPEVDGFAFVERYRAMGRSEPVIVWTIHDLTNEEHKRLHANVRAIVRKGDLSNPSLIETVRSLLPAPTEAS